MPFHVLLFPMMHMAFGCQDHSLLVAWCASKRWQPPTTQTKYTRAFLARMVDFMWVPYELENTLLGRDGRRVIQHHPGLPNVPTQTHIITHQCKMGVFDHEGPAQAQVGWIIRWDKSGGVTSIETDRPVVKGATSLKRYGMPELVGEPIPLFDGL